MSNFSPFPIFNERDRIRKHMKIGRYGQLMCEHCPLSFNESLDGLIELTFHILVSHGKEINEPDTDEEYVEYSDDWEHLSGGSTYEPVE